MSGLNDAGIETFEGDFASNVVRECVQNSLDASIARPVVVEISRHSIPKEELGFIPQLRDVLQSCRSYWANSTKARKFFDLERLWRESKRVTLPVEFTGEGSSSLRKES